MKKSVAILLLLTLTAPLLGTYVYLQFRKKMIRMEVAGMISRLDKQNLVNLTMTKEEAETRLNWKHASEFEFEGHMYDVVKTIQSGDSTVYICYKDHKESRLRSQMARFVNKALGQDPCQKSQKDKLTDFFKTVYRQNTCSWNPFSLQPSIFQYSTFNFQFSSLSLSPPSPPPKYV